MVVGLQIDEFSRKIRCSVGRGDKNPEEPGWRGNGIGKCGSAQGRPFAFCGQNSAPFANVQEGLVVMGAVEFLVGGGGFGEHSKAGTLG